MFQTSARSVILLAMLAGCEAPSGHQPASSEPARAAAPNKVAIALNAYRQRRGLAPIPVSARLTQVAAAHVADLEAHYQRGNSGNCNMHSWSANGNWTPCCYTPDHARKQCMWDKPREITGGAYSATGYEIVAYYSDPITPERALQIWQQSDGHHIMVVNQGQWYDNTWRAMGAAMGMHYAVVWFGEEPDHGTQESFLPGAGPGTLTDGKGLFIRWNRAEAGAAERL